MVGEANPAQAGGEVSEPLQVSRRWQAPVDPLSGLSARTQQVDIPQQGAQQEEPEQEEEREIQPQLQQEKPIKGDPYARARVLERERDREKRRVADLEQKLNSLTEAITRLAPQVQEEEEEQEPLNPIEAISRKTDRVLQEMNDLKKQREQEVQHQQLSQEEQIANRGIQSFMEQAEKAAPGVYQSAVAHLANVKITEYLEDNPDASEDEAKEHVAVWAREFKLRAMREGKNPGEEFLKRSAIHGFNPNVAAKPQKAPGAPKVAAPTPDPQVAFQEDLRRREALGSLSSMQGTAKVDPMKALSAIPDSKRVGAIMQEMKSRGRMNRPIPLEELLAHKMVK